MHKSVCYLCVGLCACVHACACRQHVTVSAVQVRGKEDRAEGAGDGRRSGWHWCQPGAPIPHGHEPSLSLPLLQQRQLHHGFCPISLATHTQYMTNLAAS